MPDVLTLAEHRALAAVAAGQVTRVYRGDGNILRGPKGIGAATLWKLARKRLIADGDSKIGATQIHCVMVLTTAGRKALPL